MEVRSSFGKRGRAVSVMGAVAALFLGLAPAASARPSGVESPSGAEVTPQAAITPTKVTNFNHADPAVIQHNGKIFSYATDGSDTVRKIPVISADSPLGPYTRLHKTLDRIPWANNNAAVMGPHVIHRGGDKFHMYFAARRPGGPNVPRCIGVATSTTGPRGPFVPRDHPLACDDAHNGAIAPSFFKDPRTGKNYLLYKTNGPDAIRRVFLQGLGPAGLAKVGGRTLLGKRSWNYENPQIIFSGGKYFLFMSRDLYRTADYKTTVNWSSQVDGPYPIDRAHAIMTKNNTSVAGPASAELIKLAGGQTVAFFHGWKKDGGECTRPRFLYVATIAWGANRDNPHLASPKPGGAHC